MKKGDILWIAILCTFSALLAIPATHRAFIEATDAFPYLMGFIKFAVLASMGELLAARLVSGKWNKLPGMFFKAVIWGIVGMMIVFMFTFYSAGVAGTAAKNLLFVGNGFYSPFLQAFFTSAIMNLTFAPAFMAAHRMTDTWIEMRVAGQKPKWSMVVDNIDWKGFYKFVVGKTIPFFWIPAHTVTFLLPSEYRVLVSAYLSIALGVILAYAKRRKA